MPAPALHATCAALLAGIMAAACSGKTAGGAAGGADGPGSPGFQQGAGTDAVTLAVSLSASATAACSGQCVQLTPQIRGGLAPYTVRWSDGMTSGDETREVCPTATTTYAAVVTDSSGSGGELPLAGGEAQASATIDVTPGACADGQDAGYAEDAQASGPFPTTAPRTRCTAGWDSVSSVWAGFDLHEVGASVAIDPSGNIVFATSFTKSFGTLAASAQGDSDMMVVKLDAQCRVVWSRHYGAPSSHVFVGSIRTDASGNVVLGGGFLTSFPYGLDFGTGPQFGTQSGMFVTKLDPNGKTVWVDTAIAPSDDSTTGISYAGDLAIDASGNVVLIYQGPAALGVTSDGGYAVTNELVKLDPGGKVVFAKSSDELAPAAWHIESVDVARDGSIWAAGSADEVSGDVRVVHVGANGAAIASQVVSSPSSPCSVSGGAVRVSQTAGITVSGACTPASATDWTRWFVGLSPSASPAWTRSPIVASGSSSDPAQLARVDGDGDTWITSVIMGTQDLGTPVGTLSSAAGGSLELLVLGPDGTLRSGSAFGGGAGSPALGDMALGPNRSVVLVGWNVASYDKQTFTVTAMGF